MPLHQSAALISIGDISRALGVSEQTVRTWCRLGVIPAVRPSGTRKWLVLEEDFNQWVADGGGQRLLAQMRSPRSTATDAELLEDAATAAEELIET